MTKIIRKNIESMLINEMKIAKENKDESDWEPKVHYFTCKENIGKFSMEIVYHGKNEDNDLYEILIDIVDDVEYVHLEELLYEEMIVPVKLNSNDYKKAVTEIVKKLNLIMGFSKCRCNREIHYDDEKYCNNCKWTLKKLD